MMNGGTSRSPFQVSECFEYILLKIDCLPPLRDILSESDYSLSQKRASDFDDLHNVDYAFCLDRKERLSSLSHISGCAS